jgi:SAM-dependent methyltransferase
VSSYPFDRHAVSYASTWGADPIAQRFRERVHEVIEAELPPPASFLDAGSGIGIDAGALAAKGYTVRGIDASAGMVEMARERVPSVPFDVLDIADMGASIGPFDGALANFGVLNCMVPDVAAEAFANVLPSGARLFAVVMPRVHPSFVLQSLLRLQPRRALERFRRERTLPLSGGAEIRTRYLAPADIEQAFAPWFRTRRVESLGLLLPPPGGKPLPPPFLDLLWRAEHRLRTVPGLRAMGDHVLVVLERR